jgi:hypothetical protein
MQAVCSARKRSAEVAVAFQLQQLSAQQGYSCCRCGLISIAHVRLSVLAPSARPLRGTQRHGTLGAVVAGGQLAPGAGRGSMHVR